MNTEREKSVVCAVKDADRSAATAAARAAATAALGGKSPRSRGAEKDRAALTWVYRWGWSSASVIDSIASPSRRGVAARLIKKKLLEAHECEAAGGIKGVPAQALTLTQDGVAEVEAILSADDILAYPRDGSKLIKKQQLRHDLLVQRYTAQRLNDRKIVAFDTPRELAEYAEEGEKYPDAVWQLHDETAIAVELELTAKKGRELDQALLALLKSVHPKTETRDAGPYDLAVYLSNSPGLLERYKRALAPGAQLALWERDARTRIYTKKAKAQTVPPWALERVLFERVEL